LSPALFCSSKQEDPSDRDSKGTLKPKKNEEAIKKLNLLLKKMAEVTKENQSLCNFYSSVSVLV
jgi:hypothetical protein